MESIQSFLSINSHSNWRMLLLFTGITAAVSRFVELGGFLGSYWFDITFPAFIYIYARKLHLPTEKSTASRVEYATALSLAIAPAIGFEFAQYFQFYDGTYDPYDFVAYISLVIPVFFLDLKGNYQ